MVAVAVVAVPSVTPLGRLAALRLAVNVSSTSSRMSAVVATCRVAEVLPAAMVTDAVGCAV